LRGGKRGKWEKSKLAGKKTEILKNGVMTPTLVKKKNLQALRRGKKKRVGTKKKESGLKIGRGGKPVGKGNLSKSLRG